jgi:hypothetical protein
VKLCFWLLTITFIPLMGCQKNSKPVEAITTPSPVVIVSATPTPVIIGIELPGVLSWQGLKIKYAHFSQIQVSLMNKGKVSIFLNRSYPQISQAHLERLDEGTKDWEIGFNAAAGCMSANQTPIEIKPGKRREITVDWSVAFDSFDDESCFGAKEHTHPLSGEYRLTLDYAKIPWVGGKQPEKIFSTKSPSFMVKWNKKAQRENAKGGCS